MAEYSVTLKLPDGSEVKYRCDEKETLLEAGERHSPQLPSSCRLGACSSCAGRILEGKVNRENNVFLTEEDQSKGFVLTCTAYPQSDCVIQTHQESMLY